MNRKILNLLLSLKLTTKVSILLLTMPGFWLRGFLSFGQSFSNIAGQDTLLITKQTTHKLCRNF